MISNNCHLLVSAETAGLIDSEAHTEWGFNPHALIEAAGRRCAQVLSEVNPGLFLDKPKVTVFAGSGHNGDDAMVMLRYWILSGLADADSSMLVVNRLPEKEDHSPRAELIKSLEKMGVPVLLIEIPFPASAKAKIKKLLKESSLVVDGISGTGLKGSLCGAALEMVNLINSGKENAVIVSVDIPSGISDEWESGGPIIKADLTLAIEPQKYSMYTPAARPYAGTIIAVNGIFPKRLLASYKEAELLDWKSAGKKIPKIPPNAYKNERGTVEIRAGSKGYTGAAYIAARGAQAAGAGLVKLITDDDIYEILASKAAGIMVFPAKQEEEKSANERQRNDSILLGPGWGTGPDRMAALERALELEKKGTALVLDADAIILARKMVFCGKTVLTPHPMEFVKYSGVSINTLLCRPAPILLKFAKEKNAVFMLKSHVITIASPDGRLAVIDGMLPALAAGGSGDLLAGFCAAISARMARKGGNFDVYACAAAAASLLIECGASGDFKTRFTDPLELAGLAADLAGKSWL